MRGTAIVVVIAFFAVPALADASGVHAVWSTQKNAEGGYLEITMAPCKADAALTCGTISKAFTAAGEDAKYADLGKPIVEGMKHDGGDSWSGGTIWDPENGKTYKSKMTLKGDELDVDGCISFFCEGQHWQRVVK